MSYLVYYCFYFYFVVLRFVCDIFITYSLCSYVVKLVSVRMKRSTFMTGGRFVIKYQWWPTTLSRFYMLAQWVWEFDTPELDCEHLIEKKAPLSFPFPALQFQSQDLISCCSGSTTGLDTSQTWIVFVGNDCSPTAAAAAPQGCGHEGWKCSRQVFRCWC